MAAATQGLVQTSPETNPHVPERTTVKALIQMKRSPLLISPNSPPVILFNGPKSSMTSTKPAKTGLVNHGVPESLMKAVLDGCKEFFNLPMEEKMKFADKDIWKPIRFGTGVDVKVEKFFTWRDFIKVFVHPQFHFPKKPIGFSEVSGEYCKRTREVARELFQGISEALGLEENYIEKAMDLESGLQIEHNGKWFHVNPLPNSFLVNTADHLQVLSNGKYKSIRHRAVVNNKDTRISIAVPHGPSLDTMVSPAPKLVESESRPAAYVPMKYKDYLNLQLDGKPCLDHIQLTFT
ncbi:hypothetical protein Acr_06g0013710 [Actinidia rufa]|uniref:2-oxoglutarate (2OG) and Fe(II)-dependent oxygenase superfamily protein n=1 Tax=Actinidia rufa TaxID=165716 RepID=A0A7J0ESH5_9ERIC|nr:hypothetical protein Acr_06g0013710 [Actinidia rufa]